MSDKTVLDFLPEIFELVKQQLESDQKEWGDTWKHRPIEGQEERIYARYHDYYDKWMNAGVPIEWTKVIGEAVIALVRTSHPEELD